MALDIGETPNITGNGDDDPERAVRLTAHAVARIADRIPFARRFSRQMEGTDARAGLGADIMGVIIELIRRNPDLVETQLEGVGDNLAKARARQAEKRTAKEQPKPREV